MALALEQGNKCHDLARMRPSLQVGNSCANSRAGTSRRRPATANHSRAAVFISARGDVRIGPVAALPDVLSDLGVAPRRVFARAGVKRAAFRNPESRISYEALGRLFEESEALTGCHHVGLLIGERFALKDLGAVGYLMQNSCSVGDALRALLRYLHLYDRGAAPVLLKLEPASVILGYSIYKEGIPATAQMYDAAIAIGFRILQEIGGPAWRPLAVQFAHQRPEDVRPYHRLFGPSVRFDAEVSGIAFASSWLDHSITGADPALHELISRALTDDLGTKRIAFSEQVQGVLHQMVLGGTSSAQEVARLFGIHERTLRKRLRAEETNLHRLVSQARFEIAQQLLKYTRLPTSEIAAALRYADLSTFSRAFKTWAKMSPRQYRRAP
jgi:AraC-like DNA-binding protein